MIRPAAEVFAEELNSFRDGHALWSPSDADFADVGYVSKDGAFEYYFSLDGTYDDAEVDERRLRQRAENPIQAVGGLEMLRLPLSTFTEKFIHRPWGPLLSSRMRVEEGDLKFRCVGPRGVLCYFPDDSYSLGYKPNDQIANYFKQNHPRWVEYLSSIGVSVDPDHLVFVRGTVKTTGWFLNTIQQNSARVMDKTVTHTIEYDGMQFKLLGKSPARRVDTHIGPSSALNGQRNPILNGLPPQYCYFLSYYRMKTRSFMPPRVIANAEPHSEAGGGNDGASSHGSKAFERKPKTMTRDMVQIHEPLEALLSYILEACDARAAIACHEDIAELCQDFNPPELATFLREMRPSPPIHIDDDQIAMIDMQALCRLRNQSTSPTETVPTEAPSARFPENTGMHTKESGTPFASSGLPWHNKLYSKLHPTIATIEVY